MTWVEMIEDMAEHYKEQMAGDARWTFITQQEHPVLRSPWYCLHPCESAAIMRLLLSNASCASGAADSCSGNTVPRGAEARQGAQVMRESRASCNDSVSDACMCILDGSTSCLDGHHVCAQCMCQHHLRYFRAWYSSVASIVRLPCPLTLWPPVSKVLHQ